jgi:hypothetical protein
LGKICARRRDKFDPNQDLFELQTEFEEPSPFIGRTEAVLHVLSCLQHHRLSNIVGEMGSGKTTVAVMVLYTLQQRARDAPDGRYMYRDGVFKVSCINMRTLHELVFVLGGTIGRLTSDLNELVLVLKEKNFFLVLDGAVLVRPERCCLHPSAVSEGDTSLLCAGEYRIGM